MLQAGIDRWLSQEKQAQGLRLFKLPLETSKISLYCCSPVQPIASNPLAIGEQRIEHETIDNAGLLLQQFSVW